MQNSQFEGPLPQVKPSPNLNRKPLTEEEGKALQDAAETIILKRMPYNLSAKQSVNYKPLAADAKPIPPSSKTTNND